MAPSLNAKTGEYQGGNSPAGHGHQTTSTSLDTATRKRKAESTPGRSLPPALKPKKVCKGSEHTTSPTQHDSNGKVLDEEIRKGFVGKIKAMSDY